MSGAIEQWRVILDSNIFISGLISPRGTPRAILDAWRARAFLLLMADEQRAELRDVLGRQKLIARHRIAATEIQSLLDLIEVEALRPQLADPPPLTVRDPKDTHILAAAIGGGASHLVSGDDDLLVLANDPRLGALRIVNARAFLDELRGTP